MLSNLEKAALERISTCNEPDDLRKIANNARSKSPEVERAALRRLAVIQSSNEGDPVAKDCWTMIFAVEEVRRQIRGRKSPMNRLRPKIAREGEIAALEYLACNESEGFSEVLEYGMPEFSAEAIVIRYGEPTFSPTAVNSARERLISRDLDPDELASTDLN